MARHFKPSYLLYHVTTPDRLDSIKQYGLRCDADGYIFAFTDLIFAEWIATNQVIIADSYSILWLDPRGITGEILADHVAEWFASFQCKIRQARIVPQYVHFLGTSPVKNDGASPWRMLKAAQLDPEVAEAIRAAGPRPQI